MCELNSLQKDRPVIQPAEDRTSKMIAKFSWNLRYFVWLLDPLESLVRIFIIQADVHSGDSND